MESQQPVSIAAELNSASQLTSVTQAYSQNEVLVNTDGQNFNPVPVYQQTYTAPQQIYAPQDMNHNIPNYTQDMNMDPFKPQYEYAPVSQSHQNLVYSNTDSGLGYGSNGIVYNGDVSMNYYSNGSDNNFANSQSNQSGSINNHFADTSSPGRRGPGRPTKRILSPASKDKSFICETCYKPLGTYQSLRKHMVTHTGERNYKCHLCSNSYTQKHNLTKHLLVHTGERPYVCRHCPAAYRTSHLLKNHMKRHSDSRNQSKISKEKLNFPESMDTSSIDSYDASFHDTSNETASTVGEIEATPESEKPSPLGSPVDNSDKLANKLVNHSESSSEESNKELEKESDETKKQSPDKPKFECNQCEQSFESRIKLMRHKNDHNSQKTLSCDFCSATFRWKASLDIHMRKHKGQKQPSYELKGLKIKNGNRITLKIVNSDKKNSDAENSDATDTAGSEQKLDNVKSEKKQSQNNVDALEKMAADKHVSDKRMEVQQSISNIKASVKLAQTEDQELNDESTKTKENNETRTRKLSSRRHVENPYVGSMSKSEIATPSENQGVRVSNRIQRKPAENPYDASLTQNAQTKSTKGKKFECELCGQFFTQNFSLKRHRNNRICTR